MIVTAGASEFDVDAVVFDKDGTLLDLFASWSPAGRAWIVEAAEGDRRLEEAIGMAIGVRQGEVVPDGVLAAGTMGQLESTTASILSEFGVDDASRRLIKARAAAVRVARQHLTPLGKVKPALARLAGAGLRLGVVTSDDRAPTSAQLEVLGISTYIDVIVAGDDDVEPKPSPEPLIRAAEALGVALTRVLYVGDSVVDQRAAGAAGVAGFVLVGAAAGDGAVAGAGTSLVSIEDLRVD